MTRLFATILLVLATFGLVASPVAACHADTQPGTAAPAAAQSSCHETAETAPDEAGRGETGDIACCKAMCAPALSAVEPPLPERFAGLPILHAPVPAPLAGLTPPIDKPPPRLRA